MARLRLLVAIDGDVDHGLGTRDGKRGPGRHRTGAHRERRAGREAVGHGCSTPTGRCRRVTRRPSTRSRSRRRWLDVVEVVVGVLRRGDTVGSSQSAMLAASSAASPSTRRRTRRSPKFVELLDVDDTLLVELQDGEEAHDHVEAFGARRRR